MLGFGDAKFGPAARLRTTAFDVVTLNADGSRTETIADRNGDGPLRDQTVKTTSADRRTSSVQRNLNGDDALDQTETTAIQSNGTVVVTTTDLNPDGTVARRVIATTSAGRNTDATYFDLNGDGTTDASTSDVTVLNGDGSTTRSLASFAGSMASSTMSRPKCGMLTEARQSRPGPYVRTELSRTRSQRPPQPTVSRAPGRSMSMATA